MTQHTQTPAAPVTAETIEKAIAEAFRAVFSQNATLLQQKDKA